MPGIPLPEVCSLTALRLALVDGCNNNPSDDKLADEKGCLPPALNCNNANCSRDLPMYTTSPNWMPLKEWEWVSESERITMQVACGSVAQVHVSGPSPLLPRQAPSTKYTCINARLMHTSCTPSISSKRNTVLTVLHLPPQIYICAYTNSKNGILTLINQQPVKAHHDPCCPGTRMGRQQRQTWLKFWMKGYTLVGHIRGK